MAIVKENVVDSDTSVDLTTKEGHRITNLDALEKYNLDSVDKGIAEARALRAGSGSRTELAVREALHNADATDMYKKIVTNRSGQFRVGVDVGKLKGGKNYAG